MVFEEIGVYFASHDRSAMLPALKWSFFQRQRPMLRLVRNDLGPVTYA
jgi:hypothetical protein